MSIGHGSSCHASQSADAEEYVSVDRLGVVRFVNAGRCVTVGSLGVAQATDGEGCVGVGRLDNGRGGPIGFDLNSA